MATQSIELSFAPTIPKKRKHDVCKSDGNKMSSLGQDTLRDDTPGMNGTILDLTAIKDFGSEECVDLAMKLAYNDSGSNVDHSVTELLAGKVGIGPRGGVAMAEILATNKTIVHLDLERNGLGTLGACAVFEALATNNTLRKLNMSLNDIKAATSTGNEEATRAIGTALEKNSALEEMILVRCGLGPKGGISLASGLSRNCSLVNLDLTGNDIMADGGRSIGEALKENTTLRDLNLRWNRIGCGGDRGILSLADSLRVNACLLKLDASVNELYSEGAIAFGRALKANHSLIDLSLERNEIGMSGAIAIGEALGSNTTLERLVLSGNPMMGDEGAAAIGQSLAEHELSALSSLEMVGCGVGTKGAFALGRVLQRSGSSISNLRLEKNKIGAEGAVGIAKGLGNNTSLRHLNLSRNGIQAGGGRALALALRKNKTLRSLDISNNDIEVDNSSEATNLAESSHIIESIVDHPALQDANVSSNALEIVPIDCQLRLAKIYKTKRSINIDLLDNPLSSPPLGRRASAEGLRAYLTMLLSDSTAVNRIRLMVLGFGGVGKSTFCDAVTQPKDSLQYFQSSLVPLEEWDCAMIASWARRLGTHWAPFIGSVLEKNKISGKDLHRLVVIPKDNGENGQVVDGNEMHEATKVLDELVDTSEGDGYAMSPSERKSFARAIGSLVRKGYFSTVGAVKLEELIELNPARDNESNNRDGDIDSGSLPRRKCSLVDFAGQMEYLVSHQLLLSSLHTLCVVLEPAPSFGNPKSRHFGSWMYWSRFLRALGDRRRGSLLLAISQKDKLVGGNTEVDAVNAFIEEELISIRTSIPNITESPPLSLDYRPEKIQNTIEEVRGALSGAADVVAKDWWVPSSYEKLSELVRKMEGAKKASKEVPIISREQLSEELSSVGLHEMQKDPQLFKRGIEYLEAVGDVMTDDRLDCLLLDPISWFASFLAHFIRDDDIVTSVQLDSRFVKRGIVGLEDVVSALQHDYSKPREQVARIMSLVCQLELCIRCNDQHRDMKDGGECKEDGEEGRVDGQESIDENQGVSYLFPCLLPPATAIELAKHWPVAQQQQSSSKASLVYRGYRFRSCNGFFPPGLFPGLLARCRLLHSGVMRSERMFKDCAVLVFGSTTRVLLRIDLDGAILDVVGAAPTSEELFVGAAKGQASVVIWVTHLVKMFLRRSYPQLETDESFMCPLEECHCPNSAHETPTSDSEKDIFRPCLSQYRGNEFAAIPLSGKRYKGDHSCEADGCWSQLGVGHKIERMIPKIATEHGLCCTVCLQEPLFMLRT